MSLYDDLIAAKARIDTPDKWFQGAWSSADVRRFCMVGALMGESREAKIEGIAALERALAANGWWAGVISFNDTRGRTHAEVMKIFDIAIAAARPKTRDTGPTVKEIMDKALDLVSA